MHSITAILIGYLLAYKYFALFIVCFLGAFALPLPSSVLVTTSAGLAGEGKFELLPIFLVGVVGNVLGDIASYWVARRFGKEIFYFFGLRKLTESERFLSLENLIKRQAKWYVTISRFEGFANISVNILAGMAKMPFKTFLLFDTIGEVAQIGVYCFIGYQFGSQWVQADTILSKVIIIVLIAALVLVLAFAEPVYRALRKKRSS